MKAVRIIAVILLLVIAATGSLFLTEYLHTESSEGESVTVVIPDGAAGKTVAGILKDSGLIRFKSAFVLRLRSSQYAGKLRSGTFEIHKGMCIDDIIKELSTGGKQRESVDFTIPEGFSVEQIAQRLESIGLFSAEEFLYEVNNGEFDYDILSSVPRDNVNYRLQGFLFPSTYSVYANATPHEVIDIMLREFISRYEAIGGGTNERSLFEIVTIASLVEREAKLDSERPTIAGVIENRLGENMRLQIDAAVVYAISDGLYNVDRVLYKDLEVNSPYNVYKNYGLPAGPICNPGEKSLEAAMNPESHEYLFYHTDETRQDGSHIFTKTFDEHTSTMN
ncbi:MAG: endolytic transglycosylase MltG [Clostridia bacterium]